MGCTVLKLFSIIRFSRKPVLDGIQFEDCADLGYLSGDFFITSRKDLKGEHFIKFDDKNSNHKVSNFRTLTFTLLDLSERNVIEGVLRFEKSLKDTSINELIDVFDYLSNNAVTGNRKVFIKLSSY